MRRPSGEESQTVREGERRKAERCLVDTHREDYEVMQRWLQSSPMLHTSIESPSPSFSLATTIKPSALPLRVQFSPFFPPFFSWEQLAAWLAASLRARHRTLSRRPRSAHAHVYGRIGFPLCLHRAPFDRSRDWLLGGPAVIFQRRVTGKEWRSTDCLAAFFIFF